MATDVPRGAASPPDAAQLQRELELTRTQLADAHRMASFGRMLAAVVHEINTPIGSLLSNSEVTLRSLDALKGLLAGAPESSSPPSAKAMALLETIASLAAVDKLACERIASMVRGLRTFSRLDQGGLGTVQVHGLIEDALKLADWIYGRRITVERDFGDLPEIECFPQSLSQVFLNLLVNAGQAIEVQGKVVVRTRAEGGRVHIAISDTGKGIQPEDRPKIFSPGFSTKPIGEGTGLGLVIARDIVVATHGGAIAFESQPGVGTTFHVRIPTKQPRKMETNLQPTVMIVDDEEMVIASISAYLRLETDFNIYGFTDPEEAVRHLETHPADVVVTDYLMPKLNGVQLLARAKQLQPEAARVLLTGHADKQSAILAINEVGVYQYLEKPWENAQLLLVIRSAIERTQLFRQLRDKISELDAAHGSLKDVQARLIRAFL
jgi:FixJ family two-component response regulator